MSLDAWLPGLVQVLDRIARNFIPRLFQQPESTRAQKQPALALVRWPRKMLRLRCRHQPGHCETD